MFINLCTLYYYYVKKKYICVCVCVCVIGHNMSNRHAKTNFLHILFFKINFCSMWIDKRILEPFIGKYVTGYRLGTKV